MTDSGDNTGDIVDSILPIRGPVADFMNSYRGREALITGGAGTAKSFPLCVFLLMLMDRYHGTRFLMGRKTRASMTQSILVTFERVLDAMGLGEVHASQNRSHRSTYHFPMFDSEVVILGFDDPERIKSSEYDGALVNEGTELTQDDWEILLTRLRHGVLPWQFAVMDCNPGAPTHWIRSRVASGKMKEFITVHKDNPAYWDGRTQKWTDKGWIYYNSTLAGLTGVNYLRLVKGQWVAAEGAVFQDCWERERHLAEPAEVPDLVRYVAGVDWGYRHPGVISVYGEDKDGCLWRVREIYRPGMTSYWWHAQAKRLAQDYQIEAWVCDSSRPEHIEQWNKSGLFAVESIKGKGSIEAGIRLIESALANKNGIPGLRFVKGSTGWYDDSGWEEGMAPFDAQELRDINRDMSFDEILEGGKQFKPVDLKLGEWIPGRDEGLAKENRPVCTEDEFYVYSWPKDTEGKPRKEVPVPLYDDGIDCLRYVLRYLQSGAMPGVSEDVGIYSDPAVEAMWE